MKDDLFGCQPYPEPVPDLDLLALKLKRLEQTIFDVKSKVRVLIAEFSSNKSNVFNH